MPYRARIFEQATPGGVDYIDLAQDASVATPLTLSAFRLAEGLRPLLFARAHESAGRTRLLVVTADVGTDIPVPAGAGVTDIRTFQEVGKGVVVSGALPNPTSEDIFTDINNGDSLATVFAGLLLGRLRDVEFHSERERSRIILHLVPGVL